MIGIIYKATNSATGKCYIGQTRRTLLHRQRGHERSVKRDYFHNSLRKHGTGKFVWSVLDEAGDEKALSAKERMWIEFFNCVAPRGYNLTLGGEGASHHPRTCCKLSCINLGKHPSEETRKKIASSLLGKSYLTSEGKKKISDITVRRNKSDEMRQCVRDGWNIPGVRERRLSGLKKVCTPERYARQAQAMIGNKYGLGTVQSKELRELRSRQMTGRVITWGDKISAAKKGVPKSEAHKKLLGECTRKWWASLAEAQKQEIALRQSSAQKIAWARRREKTGVAA